MIKKISTEELSVGMYVVDTGLSWLDYPYLYAKEGEVLSEEVVEEIRREYAEAFIDTSRGAAADRNASDDGFVEVATSGGEDQRERVPLAEVIEEAQRFYDDSLNFAREFMTEVSTGGKVDYERSEAFVEDVIESVTLNPDALVSMTKLRATDEYTYTHCINVSVLATAFGEYEGLPQADLMDLGIAGLLHDLGKALIPPAILNKPGRLTDAEFEIIKKHPVRSLKVLKSQEAVSERVLRAVVEHHEKYNGTGYPFGRMGDQIHHFARYVSLADVYDALTSRRAYKMGMMPHRALKIIYSMRGQDFHPGYAERFIKFLGIYPVGSLVRLSDGRYAVVCGSNTVTPLRPEVVIAFDEGMRPLEREHIALDSAAGEGLEIEECLDAVKYDVATGDFLTA